MSEEQSYEDPILAVLIVGGGLGGLMLGAILESADIPYHILERSTEARPLGSVISMSGNILPVFEQLGIYDELKKRAKRHSQADFYDTNLNKLGTIQMKGLKKVMGKKVLRTREQGDRVTVFCSDNTSYDCSILVGADGVYSAVRQNMHKKLEEEGKLPLCDDEDFSIGFINMVGVSSPPNPERFPEFKDDRAHFRMTIGDDNATSYATTVPDNQICWGLQLQLDSTQAKQQHFRNSEWGPEAIDTMLKDFEDFPCPFGGTMKELFDSTPKNLISKIFLEEKVFRTWYHGRTVLIGDACHKLLPGAGQGAIMAMKDAVVLSNYLFNMKDYSLKSIQDVFANYYKQRYQEAVIQQKNGANASKILIGQRWSDKLLRYVMLKYTPYWLMEKQQEKDFAFRPQINWLPLATPRGSGKVLPQVGREEAAAKRAEANPI
ncbi:hypothetical protein BGZ80_002180 [Entomortierella chlamydospora]|uniref:FAD-binding domain-containing protein n=1 Tax=Entomortierella chlamydospora TaxID=101097 RepID=A0A9P6N1D0_9FUNG|nr:hypothetical protein BGZ80_002180 [Entomortierella chlamydospora]